MNNWDRQNRGNRWNRSDQDRDYYGNPRQSQQNRGESYMGQGPDWNRGNRSGSQMDQGYGQGSNDWGNETDYGSSRGSRGWNRSFDQGNQFYGDDDYTGRSFTDRGYGNQRTRDFDAGSFGGDDYVTGGRRTPRSYGERSINEYGAGGGTSYGYGMGYGSAGGGYGRSGSQTSSRQDDRGFFERAGDEVASWFGDDDAARRREQDHSGRGPSNYNRSDERILEDACDHLTRDWSVDARNIQVTVDDGEVTLDGTVDSRRAKRRAEDCVDDVSGVKHVQNNLRVKESETSRDSDPNDYGTSAERKTLTTES